MTTDADSKNSGRCACGVIPLYAKGMCARCYKQSRKPGKKQKASCKCGRPSYAREMCRICYTSLWRAGAIEVLPVERVPPEEFIQLAKDVGLYGGRGWQGRLGRRLGTTNSRVGQIVSGGATTRTLEKWKKKLHARIDVQPEEPTPAVAPPKPATRPAHEGAMTLGSMNDVLDEMGVPDEDEDGSRLYLKDRLRELKHRWAEMKARDEAYGRKNPVEELLRVQAALLHKEHPDAHAAHFVREVCRLFDFAEPPPMPDNLWYRTALAVIRERVTKSS